ncbi:AN1-type zinc finger protein 4-like [Haliotis cracherodii]|uniref:AN1-type zinc finger protein 4-like n=1 Tax=Haliotis cracherodii TaxID=6455 RepID=UPI0039ECD785
MELFIETLTGTAFELRVSPFETIMSVKAKIQRLEGIPISHQHLIWQSVELEDEYCLHDYSIHNGATLKLVLAMRGGPINTRRVPVEDTALREMAEYMEANREEILDKLPGNRHVTLLVFREGDQLNFFRVVDRGDGTLTPLSESLSASVYNFNEEEEEDDSSPKEKSEENDKMKQKVTQLRLNMEKLTLTKKKPPKPPSSGHSSHSGRASSRLRLRQLPSASRPYSNTLNKNTVLPSVGCTFPAIQVVYDADTAIVDVDGGAGALLASPSVSSVVAVADKAVETLSTTTDSMDKLGQPLHILKEDSARVSPPTVLSEVGEKTSVDVNTDETVKVDDSDTTANSLVNSVLKRDLYRLSSMTDSTRYLPSTSSASRRKDFTFESFKESFRPATSSKDKVKVAADHSSDNFKRSSSSKRDISLGLRDSVLRPTTSSRYGGLDMRRKEYALESLSTSEARTVSGILRQASIEKIGSSHIGNFVSSASKSRLSNYSGFQEGRVPTPEGRLMSGHLQRLSASRDGRLLSPTHRLPPVKAKKKASKRCYVCAKKTGLATSYQCRCGNNFCATHRYAESHDCTFDYKTEGRKLLEQNNPVVSAPKLPKI